MSFGSFENNVASKISVCRSCISNIYTYQHELALNNLQGLIYRKTQPTKHFYISLYILHIHETNLQETDMRWYRVFAYGPGDRGSIPSQIISKTKKWYLIPLCLTISIIRNGSRVTEVIQRKA